jgi:hypothetical protein
MSTLSWRYEALFIDPGFHFFFEGTPAKPAQLVDSLDLDVQQTSLSHPQEQKHGIYYPWMTSGIVAANINNTKIRYAVIQFYRHPARVHTWSQLV